MTGLVFGKLFFPHSDPLVGVLEAFAIYTVGFIARPIGAAIFGHYGDRKDRDFLLTSLIFAGIVSLGTIPLAGHLSDRIGRKRMYLIGSVLTGLFGFAYFALLNTAVPALIFIAIVLSFVPHDLMYGPQTALIAECFTPRLRYSGSSIGYQLSSVISGGPAPLIATALLAATGSGYVIALYILFCAIVSIVATALMPDYTNQDISEEHDKP